MSGIFYVACVLILIQNVCRCADCPCESPEHCKSGGQFDEREVVMVGDSDKDKEAFNSWHWDSFTSVIDSYDGPINSSQHLMCKAHQERKKYGFFDSEKHPTINATDTEITTYIEKLHQKVVSRYVDFIGLNLLDVLGDCSYSEDHEADLINLLNKTLSGIKKSKVKVICGLPWEPPCLARGCSVATLLSNKCDLMVLTPSSYFGYCDNACIAKPIVQNGKIGFGITEYEGFGFKSSQILLGIPWYGYNYTCTEYTEGGVHGLCKLAKKEDGSCNVEGSRKKVSLGDKDEHNHELAMITLNYSKPDEAPWIYQLVVHGSGDDVKMVPHMTWFEDVGSLFYKYQLVKSLHLRGCMVFSATDLSSVIKTEDDLNSDMWAWLLHTVLAADPTQVKKKKNLAGLMAGLGVGMFFLGLVLGCIFACIFFRRKKTLKPPFSRDPVMDEFRDEHDDLHNDL